MLSVIIIAKNEARHIEKALQSVSFADEIIVLDSGSHDETVSIAKQYTAHVYETDWQGYGVQKARALSYATMPWVLSLDADEVVSDTLQCELREAIQSEHFDAYHTPISLRFYGKVLKYAWSPQNHVRLFRREGATYSDNIIHERILLPKGARLGRLKNPIVHDCVESVSDAVQKINRYSSLSATERLGRGQKATMGSAVFASLWMFFRSYILQKGFLDGQAGLLFSILNAEGAFYRKVKMIYPDP